MKNLIEWILILQVVISCISPVEIETVRYPDPRLVVEGYITTEAGPHFIKLSRILHYEDLHTGVDRRVTDAHVLIRTTYGENISLKHVKQGFYQTPITFLPVIGDSYSLYIETSEGETYISSPQTITRVPEIQEVGLQYKYVPGLHSANGTPGLEVLVTVEDIEDTANYYLWTLTDGVYPFVANPIGCNPAVTSCCPLVDAASHCFRYERNFNVPYNDYSFLHDLRPSCIYKYSNTFNYAIGNDRFRNGARTTFETIFVEDDGRRFEFRYRFMLNQLSISKEAYDYYSLLQSQQSISGDLFDPPPAEVGGNIFNITNPDKPGVGYFGAYDLVKKEVYASGELLKEKAVKIWFADDCYRSDSGTIYKPTWWDGVTFSE